MYVLPILCSVPTIAGLASLKVYSTLDRIKSYKHRQLI